MTDSLSVASQGRTGDLRRQLEHVAQPLLGLGVGAGARLSATTYGHPRHLAERAEDADGLRERVLALGVDEQDVAEHPLAEDLPHEVEALLARACRTGRAPARGRS